MTQGWRDGGREGGREMEARGGRKGRMTAGRKGAGERKGIHMTRVGVRRGGGVRVAAYGNLAAACCSCCSCDDCSCLRQQWLPTSAAAHFGSPQPFSPGGRGGSCSARLCCSCSSGSSNSMHCGCSCVHTVVVVVAAVHSLHWSQW